MNTIMTKRAMNEVLGPPRRRWTDKPHHLLNVTTNLNATCWCWSWTKPYIVFWRMGWRTKCRHACTSIPPLLKKYGPKITHFDRTGYVPTVMQPNVVSLTIWMSQEYWLTWVERKWEIKKINKCKKFNCWWKCVNYYNFF